VNCDDPRHPSDDDVREINSLRRQLAEYLDFSQRPRMVAELLSPDAQAWAIDEVGRAHMLRLGGAFQAGLDPRLMSDMALAVHAPGLRIRPEATRWHDGTSWLHVKLIPTAPRFRRDSLSAVLLITRAPLPLGITPRELDALTLAAHGLTNNQIAAQLYISARTAGHHVENAMAKLGATNRASCVSYAVTRGLLSGHVLRALHSGTVTPAAG
jgi:DNA-binding CsgD family transcriptional regulator